MEKQTRSRFLSVLLAVLFVTSLVGVARAIESGDNPDIYPCPSGTGGNP